MPDDIYTNAHIKRVRVIHIYHVFSGEVVLGDVCAEGRTALSEKLLEDPPC